LEIPLTKEIVTEKKEIKIEKKIEKVPTPEHEKEIIQKKVEKIENTNNQNSYLILLISILVLIVSIFMLKNKFFS
jgi:hypothetical protein